MAKILIIDDERDYLHCLRDFLARRGHSVNISETAEGGLAYYEENDYDIILLDIRMPGNNGFYFLENIKHNNKRVPIIVMSQYNDYANFVDSYEGGAYLHIPKPVNLRTVEDYIEKVIDLKKKILDKLDMKELGELKHLLMEMISTRHMAIKQEIGYFKEIQNQIDTINDMIERHDD